MGFFKKDHHSNTFLKNVLHCDVDELVVKTLLHHNLWTNILLRSSILLQFCSLAPNIVQKIMFTFNYFYI